MTLPAIEGVTWTAEHEAAWAAYVDGQHVAILGPGGTGKSTLLRCIAEHAAGRVVVTGSTGRAAINVGGCTFHSAIGLGLEDGTPSDIARSLRRKCNEAKRRHLLGIKVFIIDELSMLRADTLEAMAIFWRGLAPASKHPKPDDPWGGLVQIVGFGDPLQLPPVVKAKGAAPWETADLASQYMFFRAPCFEAVRGVQLTQVFRQDDRAFIDALGNIRRGRWTTGATILMNVCAQSYESRGVTPPAVVPHVMPRRDAAAKHNRVCMARLPGASRAYQAEFTGPAAGRDTLRRGCRAPELLELKVGATVVVVANVDVRAGLANGTQAVVVEMGDDSVDVAVDGEVFTIKPHAWRLQVGQSTATMTQLPLILGFAMTIHACQGMTLRWLRASLNNVWDLAQVYVVLSRVTRPDGLHLVDVNLARIMRLRAPEATVAYLAGLKK